MQIFPTSVPELSIASKPESEAVRVNFLEVKISKMFKKISRVLAVERRFCYSNGKFPISLFGAGMAPGSGPVASP